MRTNAKAEDAGNEIQPEIQKQLKMMPGQEKMIMEYYQKNPSAADSLRGTIYENKIIESIKSKAIITKKEISKDEAEKILKSAHEYSHDHSDTKENTSLKKPTKLKKAKSVAKTPNKVKKVSKK